MTSATASTASTDRSAVLVSAAELAQALADAQPPTVLDVRWRLGEPAGSGQARYAAAHLPGARWIDLETVLTRHTGDPRDGRHPLPDVATLYAGLLAAGVRDGRPVVVYDEGGSFAASRAWWVLTWAGIPTRVLDGGIDAWTDSGQSLTLEQPGPGGAEPGRLHLTLGCLPTITADEAAALAESGVLVDVRAPERYRGELEPLDPVAGHIPGSVNVPVTNLFTVAGALPEESTLRERLAGVLHRADAGGPVGTYCGSGVSAAQAVLALRTLGVDAALFPGSWSAWSNDPTRPSATGHSS
ncbi:MAG: sulfurtransferase [Actinomycetales bacterium]|nr:sulfurtransferase [Actinomycetales bacterium]